MIALRTNDYLNITITKTGFDLLNYLLTVFGDSNKQNLSTSSDDQTALSLVNGTGRNILISDLHGLEVIDFIPRTFIDLRLFLSLLKILYGHRQRWKGINRFH